MSSDDGSTVVPSLDSLKAKVTAVHEADSQSGYPRRELGVTWKDVSVEVPSAEAALHENVLSQWNIPQLIKESRRKPPIRTILDQSHGCVKPGEMLLVLGRPGSGCTTLLNILANKRNGYANVSGDVHYGSMEAKDAAKYRGQILMNTEEELFFPSLTVRQTMDFATRLKLPFKLPGSGNKEEYRKHTRDFLLESVGIEHTLDTKVGDAFLRGVSGGERKRVSIVECLATKGSIFCWDNSTRGLDASTALEYTKVIRTLTDVLGTASIVSLYQAGNGIFELFDKVLILDEGKQIYYGPMKAARPFMEDLGFICPDGANVADYLTGVTIPSERKVRPEMRFKFPKTGAAIRNDYERSDIYKSAITEYDFPSTDDAKAKTEDFKTAVSMEKHKSLAKDSPYTVSFAEQVSICIKRQYQIIWGDKVTFFMKQIFTIFQALIAGSLLYNAPPDSSGLFIKSGALFFSLLYNTLVAMSEVTNSFAGRPVLIKHKSFGFFHPAAFCIAEVAADIPVIFAQVSLLSLIVYFMVNLTASAGAFFTFWVVVFSATICMTAMFRAIGAVFPNFDSAIKVAGLVISATFMYTGYMIQKPHMHPWFVWIFWIDPLAYAFDSLLSNEFAGKIVPCVGTNLIPNGPGFTDKAYQSCGGVPGATGDKTYVTGEEYLSALSYGESHIWRNFGVVWGWWVLFLVATIWATSRWKAVSEQGPSLLIPREKNHLALTNKQSDEEGRMGSKEAESSSGTATPAGIAEPTREVALEDQLERNTSIFTWKNLSYTVKTPQGDRCLLNDVQGWVEPGKLVALMGSSGAGKTTLLDVLAQRKTEGTIEGSILVDGRPLAMSFQRSAGYCEQLDVHESYATVREALEFSALLRQSRTTLREEKLAYVETIIDLLELHDIADTLIGEVGAGLSVEQRKRVTIGVELVSKPSILIFLDEPTSGLDGQSAFRTVSFLRKLAAVGQAVMVTIHQPSAQLFYQFDNLLLLAKGGKTVYFGEIGEEAATVKDYFARHGVPCPTKVNPAEHMIDVVSGQHSKSRDWSEVWLSTPEYEKTTQHLDELIRTAASHPSRTVDDGFEFAMPLWDQVKIVTHRMNVSLYRNTDYANNKFALHIFSALFNGFTFWMVGDSVSELQLKLFTIYNFIFVAPGVLQQLQPLFIHRRDIFETREKKSKMYSWIAFVTALIVSEIPYLIVCAVLYFVCWYYPVGFPTASTRAGATFFVILMYEFLYTGIGQFVAAYAPNAMAANLINPLLIGTMVSFCGVLVPYAQIQPFWRYWMYYINPFNYLMGSMLVFNIWGAEVHCRDAELAKFNPPSNMTCGEYLASYKESPYGMMSNLLNPEATASCKVCSFSAGEDYLRTLNLNEYYYGWRDAGIVALLVLSSYMLVYLLMKLRTKMAKTAQ